jgi:hypothetical protein
MKTASRINNIERVFMFRSPSVQVSFAFCSAPAFADLFLDLLPAPAEQTKKPTAVLYLRRRRRWRLHLGWWLYWSRCLDIRAGRLAALLVLGHPTRNVALAKVVADLLGRS